MTNEEAIYVIHNYLYNNGFHLKSDIWEAMKLAEVALEKQVELEKHVVDEWKNIKWGGINR